MVEVALSHAGCLGARMTGGGFGGCTVNLVRADATSEFTEHLAEGYERETDIEPDIYELKPAERAETFDCRDAE
jgi:galactokinase